MKAGVKMLFQIDERTTEVDDWSFKEGLPLVGFKYRKADDLLDLNSKQERIRLVGFKYQKGYDWLDSQFHCSYLESRGDPDKNAGNIGTKTREIISLSFPVAHAHTITSSTP
jgi:hypothetical protein